jgi:hypothetical protein
MTIERNWWLEIQKPSHTEPALHERGFDEIPSCGLSPFKQQGINIEYNY